MRQFLFARTISSPQCFETAEQKTGNGGLSLIESHRDFGDGVSLQISQAHGFPLIDIQLVNRVYEFLREFVANGTLTRRACHATQLHSAGPVPHALFLGDA